MRCLREQTLRLKLLGISETESDLKIALEGLPCGEAYMGD